MACRFLTSITFWTDAFAISDFESLATGLITDISSGVTVNADASWDATITFQR